MAFFDCNTINLITFCICLVTQTITLCAKNHSMEPGQVRHQPQYQKDTVEQILVNFKDIVTKCSDLRETIPKRIGMVQRMHVTISKLERHTILQVYTIPGRRHMLQQCLLTYLLMSLHHFGLVQMKVPQRRESGGGLMNQDGTSTTGLRVNQMIGVR